MITAIDRITIEVPDLAAAAEDYAVLLGEFPRGDNVRLPLANTTLELTQGGAAAPGQIRGLSFLDNGLGEQEVKRVPSPNEGVRLQRIGTGSRRASKVGQTGIGAVDHVVLQTTNADRCLRTFGKPGLGLRLALDQDKPRWGGRMLFFRTGELTLEIVESYHEIPERDYFWGIAYQCEDLELTLKVLAKLGVEATPSREGRKEGTRVATLKSHNLGIPTLLIEHLS